MASEPRWINEPLVTAIHRRQIAEHGGIDGLRDAGLLRSALARSLDLFSHADPAPGLAALAATQKEKTRMLLALAAGEVPEDAPGRWIRDRLVEWADA